MMRRVFVVTTTACSLAMIGALLLDPGTARATEGCKWDEPADAFATTSECGSWDDYGVTWSEGCDPDCSAYAYGEFTTESERFWFECLDGNQVNYGTGSYTLDELIVLDCGEDFTFVWNHGCDANPGQPCYAGPGVLEFAMQAKCVEC
jgi:hypothetical protein